ncbi:tetratricopeptide repeat protein [Streptomyces sp. NPDC059755]|uniref:tetratricopeptide repeat protein n=1 Tax=Streptomyces sp. NPDC059755 TaxID=3346934 RepID=UPI00365480B9
MSATDGPQPQFVQNVTAVSGFAYGAIGADIHVFGDGSPVYLLQNWQPAVPADPAWLRELPSRMLNSRFEVVPFTGRETELSELRAWRDGGPRLAARWIHAPGGQGKTRLAARFADETRDGGWRVVTAVHGPGSVQPPPGSQDLTLDGHGGVLLVVDYADRWPLTHLTWLFSNALLHQDLPARILLLARTADAWPAVRASLANHRATASSRALDAPPDGPAMYQAARDAFAVRYGFPVGSVPGSAPPYELTLALHMAALVVVDAQVHGRRAPTDLAGLTVYLLDREHLHWATLHARCDAGATPPAAMNKVVFAAALAGAADRTHGVEVVRALRLGTPVDRVLDDHAHCYPPEPDSGDTVLEPLYPDRLAEDFLALTLPGHQADYPAMEWAEEVIDALLGRHASRGITFLAAAAQRWPHVGPDHLYPILATAPGLALAAGSAALSALAALEDVPIRLLAAVEERFPIGRHVELDAGMAAVTRRLVTELLALDDSPVARAVGCQHLSTRLLNAGLDAEALEVARRGVTAARELDHDVPVLAAALGRLGDCLAHNGHPAEALRATEEAAALAQPLAEAERARHEPLYTGILADLAVRLAEAGRHQDALEVGERAATAWRQLSAADPAHEPRLADALHAHGRRLSHQGLPAESAAVSREALSLRISLAEQDAAGHEPGLAASLLTLSAQLASEGRRAEALACSQQAVQSMRALARADPTAHDAGLAHALQALGADLAEAGQLMEGIDTTAESIAVWRRLARDNPAAHSAELSKSLSNLALLRLFADPPTQALPAATEAVQLMQLRHAEAPELHRADLGRCLSILAVCLNAAGRRQERHGAAADAVRQYGAAWKADPVRYAFDLARVLDQMGRYLADDERWADALDPLEGGLALAEAYTHVDPTSYAPLISGLRTALDDCRRRIRQPWWRRRGQRPRG